MRVPIIAIIEFLGIAVAYFYNAGEFMYRSVRMREKGMECVHAMERIKRKQKEGAGPSFLVGCIWDDR